MKTFNISIFLEKQSHFEIPEYLHNVTSYVYVVSWVPTKPDWQHKKPWLTTDNPLKNFTIYFQFNSFVCIFIVLHLDLEWVYIL